MAPSPEQLEELKRQALKEAFPGWSREELETLSTLYRERVWTLFLRYLQLMEDQVTKDVWDWKKDHAATMFLRGQKRAIDVIEKAPEELKAYFDALREGENT